MSSSPVVVDVTGTNMAVFGEETGEIHPYFMCSPLGGRIGAWPRADSLGPPVDSPAPAMQSSSGSAAPTNLSPSVSGLGSSAHVPPQPVLVASGPLPQMDPSVGERLPRMIRLGPVRQVLLWRRMLHLLMELQRSSTGLLHGFSKVYTNPKYRLMVRFASIWQARLLQRN